MRKLFKERKLFQGGNYIRKYGTFFTKVQQMYQMGNTSAAIDNFDIFPLGSIIPWVNKPEKDSLHQEELPDGWVLCDGNVILKGQLKLTHTTLFLQICFMGKLFK